MNGKNTLSIITLSLITAQLCFAQTVNKGQMIIMPNTEVSTLFDLSNKESGVIINDGIFYIYKNFQNDGLFDYSSKKSTGYTRFESPKSEQQLISGSKPTSFYDVLFNNALSRQAFDLKNDISIAGTANFTRGIVQVDSLAGSVLFAAGAKAINVSDASFVDGEVEKVGKEAFDMPIGSTGYYRRASISAPKAIQDNYLAKYYLKNSNPSASHLSKDDLIAFIDDKEYWTVNKGKGVKENVILTLTWDDRTTPSKLFEGEEPKVHIVRWDEVQKKWISQGGFMDATAKTVTSIAEVDNSGIFTLARMKSKEGLEPGSDKDVEVFNAVTPNGDGNNDVFFIKNIHLYPNNTVQIYNRWGVKVFDVQGYDNVNKAFKGMADGRVIVDKKEKLPTGTYFYILTYESTLDKNAEKSIKKSGYLHLENN